MQSHPSSRIQPFRASKPRQAAGTKSQRVTPRAVAIDKRSRRVENVQGDFYVDHTCIDCDTCRFMAPEVFDRAGNMSRVFHQPESEEERLHTLQAMLSCPTGSIRNAGKTNKEERQEAQRSMPIRLTQVEGAEVYHCGWHDKQSFGASSYLLVRPEHGNILIDSPRYNRVLADRIAELGGVKHIFLTHIDDVGAHKKWAAHFGATRWIHREEVEASTADVEMQITGSGPWRLGDGMDVQVVHTPGHTAGSCCLYHAPSKTYFTGDHVGFSGRVGRLTMFRMYAKGPTFELQAESIRKMLDREMLNILPGHGRRVHYPSHEHAEREMNWMIECEKKIWQ